MNKMASPEGGKFLMNKVRQKSQLLFVHAPLGSVLNWRRGGEGGGVQNGRIISTTARVIMWRQ